MEGPAVGRGKGNRRKGGGDGERWEERTQPRRSISPPLSQEWTHTGAGGRAHGLGHEEMSRSSKKMNQ